MAAGLTVRQLVAGGVDLAHARIKQRQHPLGTARRGHRLETGHRQQRQVGGDRQALRRAAGNAQAGKGARTDAESDAVKPADSDAGLGEQFADERQQGFGMRATGRAVALAQLAIAPQGAGAAFGRGFEGQDVHGATF